MSLSHRWHSWCLYLNSWWHSRYDHKGMLCWRSTASTCLYARPIVLDLGSWSQVWFSNILLFVFLLTNCWCRVPFFSEMCCATLSCCLIKELAYNVTMQNLVFMFLWTLQGSFSLCWFPGASVIARTMCVFKTNMWFLS